MTPKPAGLALAIGCTLAAWTSLSAAATPWKIVYPEQGTTSGFYDATPTSPVGGNLGRTLGEQRRIAFEKAVSVWADVLSSSVPITIEARMIPLECDENGAILGQASPSSAVAMRAASGAEELTYPIALANALDGSDLEPPSSENPSGAEVLAEFNSDLGKAGCLDGTTFYLGLDGKADADSDFLGVALHELGHGFGFSSFLDYETGEALIPEAPDSFSTLAFDLDRQSTWAKLNQTQLLSSLKNARRVVWNGSHVKPAAPRYLVKGAPRLVVTPAVVGLSGMLSEHDDSPKVSEHPATGPLVVPSPASGCDRPSNAAYLDGAIALVDPGNDCHALEAVAMMEDYGAVAVITVDPTGVRPPAMISGILEGQAIPVVTVHRDDATLLAAQALGRTIVLDGDPSQMIGADREGRLYLNVTDPIEEGTSISHWDPLARSQLLMEPERSAGHLDLDVTREFMWDLGWPICGDGAIQGIETCDDGNVVGGDSCTFDCKKVADAENDRVDGRDPTTGDDASEASGADNQVSCSCRMHERAFGSKWGALTLGLALMARLRTRKPGSARPISRRK